MADSTQPPADASSHAALFDAHPDAQFVLDGDGRLLEANRAMTRLLADAEVELPGRDLRWLTHPADLEIARETFHRALQVGPTTRELRLQISVGPPRWVQLTLLPLARDPVRVAAIVRDVTDRVAAESALAASEQRFRGLFEGAGAGIAITDLHGRFVDANAAYQRMLGYSLAELRRRGILSLTHPDDRERNRERIDALLAGDVDAFVLEKRYLAAGDTEVWVRASVSLIRDVDGAPIHIAASVEDITATRLAEERLDRSERLRRLAGELARVGGWALDIPRPDAEPRLYWSEETYALVDAPEGAEPTLDEALGLYPPESRERVEQAVSACLEHGEPFELEVDSDTFSGRRIAVRIIGEPQHDGTGRAVGAMGAIQDVSRERATRRRLEEREARLRRQAALLDEAQDAILVCDLEHRVLYWNRSAERIYGYTAREAVGASARDLLYDDPSGSDAASAGVLDDGAWRGELIQRTRDGSPVTVSGRWTLMRDHDGRPEAVLAINTDVTEQRRTEHLLLRAQRMESLGTLAGGIAHDLNNLLSPILMASDLLADRVDPAARELVDTIGASARRGADLVSQVLSFARGVDGERAPVDVSALLGDVRAMVRDTFPKHVELAVEADDARRVVTGDRTQLQQVLLNLTVNARDAMPDGGRLTLAVGDVRLSADDLTAEPDAEPGAFVRLEVIDTGVGMSPEVCERVFDPFFTTKPHGSGTGLGLSTAAAIVRSHGGRLQVDSAPGAGSRFTVDLPASERAPGADPPREPEPPRPDRAHAVLVVDDEAEVRQVVAATLEQHGYRVREAADGEEALAVVAAEPVDLVLTDMMMPRMNGPETVAALRARAPDLPIVGASGLVDSGLVEQARRAGLERFVPKPFTARSLLTEIADAVTPAAATTGTPAPEPGAADPTSDDTRQDDGR